MTMKLWHKPMGITRVLWLYQCCKDHVGCLLTYPAWSLSWPSTNWSIQISLFTSCWRKPKCSKPQIRWPLSSLFLLKFSEWTCPLGKCSSQVGYIISSAFNIMLLPGRQTNGRNFRPSMGITEIVPNALKFIFICAAAYKLLSRGMCMVWITEITHSFPHW